MKYRPLPVLETSAPPSGETRPVSWLEIDTPLVVLHWQPAALFELLQMRELDIERVVRGTATFLQDIVHQNKLITPRQLALLIDNTCKLTSEGELGFLLGHRLFPGHFGALSSLLTNAENLLQAIAAITTYPMQYSPLCTPSLHLFDDRCEIIWRDPFGLFSGRRAAFITEAFIVGFIDCCNWLSDSKLTWQLDLPFPVPDHSEYYQVHLGSAVRFWQPEAKLSINRASLYQPWPRASRTGFELAIEQCNRAYGHSPQRGFVDVVRHYLQTQSSTPPSLADTAAHFDTSSATLKRRLANHNLSFQRLVDEVRKTCAMQLLTHGDMSSLEIAHQLKFHDANNFRRAFKRWTGFTPGEIRKVLLKTD